MSWQTFPVAMREECRNFESRTYANGDTVRKCHLDLAPDAPWRCPDNCPGYELRIGIGWTYGSLTSPATPADPPGLDDGTAAAVLDQAEDIVNSAGEQLSREYSERGGSGRRGPRRTWRRLFGR